MTQLGEAQATRDTGDIDDDQNTKEFTWAIVGYTIVVMIFTLVLQRLSGVAFTWLRAWGRQWFQVAEATEEGSDLQGVWREPGPPVEVMMEREVAELPAPPPPPPEAEDDVVRFEDLLDHRGTKTYMANQKEALRRARQRSHYYALKTIPIYRLGSTCLDLNLKRHLRQQIDKLQR